MPMAQAAIGEGSTISMREAFGCPPSLVNLDDFRGALSNVMFTGTDWLATLAGLLSFDIPTDRLIDSVDVARDWMSDVDPIHQRSLVFTTPNGLDHVRMGELKLILDQDLNPMALMI